MIEERIAIVLWMHMALMGICFLIGWHFFRSNWKYYVVVAMALLVNLVGHAWGTQWWLYPRQEVAQMFLLRLVALSVLAVLVTQSGDFVHRFRDFLGGNR
jgi:hypothetical protein